MKLAVVSAGTGTLEAEVPMELREHEPRARAPFGAIVRAPGQLASPQQARVQVAMELDELQPTRRVNRVRQLLGRLPKPGKSRTHARRVR